MTQSQGTGTEAGNRNAFQVYRRSGSSRRTCPAGIDGATPSPGGASPPDGAGGRAPHFPLETRSWLRLDAPAPLPEPPMKRKTWRLAGINFDHFHMGDLLRYAAEHPQVEIVGISDEQPARMEESVRKLGIDRSRVFTDYRRCLEQARPDVVILCPAASKHGEWVKKVAAFGPHIMVEKPFAASLKEADAMVKAMPAGATLESPWGHISAFDKSGRVFSEKIRAADPDLVMGLPGVVAMAPLPLVAG